MSYNANRNSARARNNGGGSGKLIVCRTEERLIRGAIL